MLTALPMSYILPVIAGYFGPPVGCYAVVFVDDVSMPQAETYGAQPPIEVLRQGIDLGLWYDRKTNVAMNLIDVQVHIFRYPPTLKCLF